MAVPGSEATNLPPVTSTRPLGKSVAVCPHLPMFIGDVGSQGAQRGIVNGRACEDWFAIVHVATPGDEHATVGQEG